jgi:FkbM family methyltransferase
MNPGNTASDWEIAPIRVARRCRFGIALGSDATIETDPVAAAYRNGSLAPLSSLIEVALRVLKPGHRVLDLGAHLGGFALSAAALGCEVIAVEAAPKNASLLQISADYNHFQNLQVVHAAVGDQSGTIEFSCHGPWGHVATAATAMPFVTVPAIRVDDLLAQQQWETLDFVKLDVEGSEIRALRGMPKQLGRPDAPIIFFESNTHTLGFYGRSHRDLKNELRRAGYAIYEVRPCNLIPCRDEDEQVQTVQDYLACKRLPPGLSALVSSASTSVWRRIARWLGVTGMRH